MIGRNVLPRDRLDVGSFERARHGTAFYGQGWVAGSATLPQRPLCLADEASKAHPVAAKPGHSGGCQLLSLKQRYEKGAREGDL
jgi:hypothetical protein